MREQPLTVTALTKYLKYVFDHDTNLQNVFIKGEISNFKAHSRGHYYFTLKDEQSQISAIMFANDANKVTFKVEDGMKVILEGYVSIYPQGGSYQIYVSSIILDGIGQLFLQFEQLKEKLFKEGLFDPNHKLSLPAIPKRVGVITSNTGAAVRDILTTIERRFPLTEVILFPTLVQGDQAKQDIVKSIQKANLYPGVDVIILGRGGGSIEDLWCFNEEMVARAIYASRIPIISAVGHETDFTIADYVADIRAATPTAAAEICVPNKMDLLYSIKNTQQYLYQIMTKEIKNYANILHSFQNSVVFTSPKRLFEHNYLKIDRLTSMLDKHNPLLEIKGYQDKLIASTEKLTYLYTRQYDKNSYPFIQLMNKLDLVNPVHILKKGYAMVQKNQTMIQSIDQVDLQDEVHILLKDGSLICKVRDKEVTHYE